MITEHQHWHGSFCPTVSNVFILVALYTERQLSKVRRETLLALKRESSVNFNRTAEFRALSQVSGGIIFLKLFSKADCGADPPQLHLQMWNGKMRN